LVAEFSEPKVGMSIHMGYVKWSNKRPRLDSFSPSIEQFVVMLDDKTRERSVQKALLFEKDEDVLQQPRWVFLAVEAGRVGRAPVSDAFDEEVKIDVEDPQGGL